VSFVAFGKKNNKAGYSEDEKKSAAGYYELKTKAVNDLIEAEEGKAPEYSKEELNKYRSRRGRFHLPDVLKIILIKFWFAAMICFFFIWGLGGRLGGMIDTILIVGAAFGIVTDLLENNAIRFFAKTEGEYDKWMMFPRKRYVSFILNIIYSILVIFIVYMLYNAINLVYIKLSGNQDQILLGVEPILFGAFCMGVDMAFVGMKNLFKKILADAKRSA
jgi:hypothetical protein